MCFNRIRRLNESLIFRLTIWYGIVFAVSSFIVLSIFYFRIQTITLQRTDHDLMEEIREFTGLMNLGGRALVIKGIAREAESEPANEIFFRLMTVDGRDITSSDLSPWGNLSFHAEAQDEISKSGFFVETVSNPEYPYDVRTVYSLIGPSEIMQIGMSLKDNEAYLTIFRNLLMLLVAPIFLLAILVGWFMAKKALAGLEEVTQTATEISRGSYDKRVQVINRSTEVNKLAVAFNHMVDQLQNLLKAMKDMIDNIAHDLRSPLTRIRGIAEMTLIANTEIGNYKEMAVSTVEECDNLIDVINTMLDITEAESGFMELQLEEIDLSMLVRNACELFSPLANEKNIDFDIDVPENIMVKGDKHKLQRIVTNLLENAIKYTVNGGNVFISMEISKDDTIKIIIQDNGIGIAESELPYIFNRFYRCDTSRSQSGIGLGLSLVKVFSEALGGTVTAASTLNQGSTFTVVLPK